MDQKCITENQVLVQDLNENLNENLDKDLDENLAWLSQKTEDPKSDKENLTSSPPHTHTHTHTRTHTHTHT